MKIAVASGKGGTGKTTLAVNLAQVANREVQLLDCDVEEPNAHLFLKGVKQSERTITIPVPQIDASRCDGCGDCVEFCQFNAIAMLGTTPQVFPELCRGCGGCMRVCPKRAIREIDNRIGTVRTSRAAHITLVEGRLDVGARSEPPLIRAVKKEARNGLVILDAPPGTSCPAVATLSGVDFALLATEPTRFGLHDLRLAMDVAREMRLDFGVVVNRAESGMTCVRDYCRAENIAILAEIPDDRRIAEAYSRGELIAEALPEYRNIFHELLQSLAKNGGET